MSAQPLLAGRFQLEKIIGRGGNGNVYRGIDLQTKQLVAVKSLKMDILPEEPTLLTRFMQEAEMLGQLNHPNIVKIITTVEEDDEHYLIMDYVEGGSLRDVLAKTPQLSIDRVLHIGLDISDALTRAHRMRIIHRDIKPSNILLDKHGTPYLTDFGVARMMDSGLITKTGDLIGTSAYLSPEVLTGETADPRSDIWSLGIVFYEMLAGRRPFDEEQQVAILVSILNKPVPDLRKHRHDTPLELVNLINEMLEKDRDKRIPSVRLVGAQLEAIIGGLDTNIRRALPPQVVGGGESRFQPSTSTISRRPPTEAEKAVLSFKRRVSSLIILMILLLAILLMFFVFIVLNNAA